MRRPRKTFPKSPGYLKKMTPAKLPDPNLDPIAFEELIKNRGVRWCHQKAVACPNITDINIQNHDPNCKKCENGLLYFDPMEIHGVLQANKLERMYEIQGVWDVGEAVVTFSAYTDDKDGNPGMGDPVSLQHFDRVTCLDYEFRWQELIECSPTGIDRLRYPALSVQTLQTTDKVYYIDQDFVITAEGHIKWIGKMPKHDQLNDRGQVYTISYSARPVFIVVQLLHEIRATKAEHIKTGKIEAIRLPQQVLIRRDYLFRHPDDDKGQPTTRFPRSGGNVTPG